MLRRLLKAGSGQGRQPQVLQGWELGSEERKPVCSPTGEETGAGKLGPLPTLSVH